MERASSLAKNHIAAEARVTHDAVIAELLESRLTGAQVGALVRGLWRVIAENG